jgi:formylglycine-generating enzyme required for sulfatase activity
MGNKDGMGDEKPEHHVSVPVFAIGKTEVTQGQWMALMGSNPSRFAGCNDCPVENVSWMDANAFIDRLNTKTGKQYRLPSEAEWEGGFKSEVQRVDDDASRSQKRLA